jgi:uncharacterized membrane protein YdjX (TVP38/TMEM64 family)
LIGHRLQGRDSDMPAATEQPPRAAIGRWLPLIVIALLMAIVFGMGWHKYLSFKTIGLNYEAMQGFIGQNLILSLIIYMAAYIVVVALSLPGGLVMTLSGGLLFGWQLGIPATVLAATIGATIIFLVAKTSFGESLAAKAGPWIGKLRDGFQENALSYLLFLRLVPIFPFVVVNLAPALLGVPLRTYVLGTFFGIIPGTSAYALAGAGLGSIVEAQNTVYNACVKANGESGCTYNIDFSALVTKELVFAGIALGLVALMPVAINIFRKKNRNDAEA